MERTRALIGDAYAVREVDWLAVAGKEEAVAVFELVGEEPLPADIASAFTAFRDGLTLYRRAEWDAAADCFRVCLEAKLDDPPTQAFLARIDELKTTGAPADWDGVWRPNRK